MMAVAARQPAEEVRLALEAMATRFELVLRGPDSVRLRAAGEEALDEIARLDRQLSFYRPSSDVSWVNGRAADGPVSTEPGLFGLLERCHDISTRTGGAFDITVAPLMRAWRFVGEQGAIPDAAVLERARMASGFAGMRLDRTAWTVEFLRRGMSIDLGAAGKGFAIDAAIAILREHGITHALLHGGTSSVHAVGPPDDVPPWTIGWAAPDGVERRFALRDTALSISAVHGKSFTAGGREYGHVLDPRTGAPCARARAAAVTGPGSFECDALSTALLVLGPDGLPSLCGLFPGYEGSVVT